MPKGKPAAVESDADAEEEAITLPVQRGLKVAKVVRKRRGCRIMVVWYGGNTTILVKPTSISSCGTVVLPHSILTEAIGHDARGALHPTQSEL